MAVAHDYLLKAMELSRVLKRSKWHLSKNVDLEHRVGERTMKWPFRHLEFHYNSTIC